MPNSRSRRTTPSRQERQQLQREARQAQAERRQSRGFRYVAAIGLVAILFVFGVLGQNLRSNKKADPKKVQTTSAVGQPKCPNEDMSSERKIFFEVAPGRCIDGTKVYDAVIKTTAGNMTAEIYPRKAFNAANNFIFLARYHFYDGLPIHRVFKNTFAQSGDPIAPNVSGPGYVVPDDGLPASSSEYVRGSMLFAHEAADLNGSQFLFITGSAGQTLRPTFPLFGQVTKGIAVLDKINDGATDDSNTQRIRYSIISITIEEHKTSR
jgi:cyclophilin family peptidyl-prolyl cis-trans isomerase